MTSVETAPRVPPGRLWFGLIAAGVAWVMQGLLSVLIATEACQDGNPSGAHLGLELLTLIALVLAVAGGTVTYLNWRRLAEQPRLMRSEGRSREEFLALVGAFLSVIFIVGIIWGGLPLVLVNVCEAVR